MKDDEMIDDLKAALENLLRIIVTTQDSEYDVEFFRDLLDAAFPLSDVIVRLEANGYMSHYEIQDASSRDVVLGLCFAVQKYDVDTTYSAFKQAKNLSARFASGIRQAENFFVNSDEGKVLAFARSPAYRAYQYLSK
jgi:hypothetical protein